MDGSESATGNSVQKTPSILYTSAKWKNATCVFCGSSSGNDEEFSKAAIQLGRALAETEVPLVYGGGTNGLVAIFLIRYHVYGRTNPVFCDAMRFTSPFQMGAIAQSTYISGGRVLGVMPRALMAFERTSLSDSSITKSIKQPKLESSAKEEDRNVIVFVETMHERKQLMAKFAQAGFMALPGGFGTMEEVLEMVTWSQLKIHAKPMVLLNINEYYSPLRNFIRGAIQSGFIKPENESFIVYVDRPQVLPEDGIWDWGKAAVQAIKEWNLTSRGEAYELDWDVSKA